MVKIQQIRVKAFNDKILQHKLYRHEPKSDTLVIILPGGNYSCDKPLLHYLRKSSVDNNCDVLCIDYSDVYKELAFGKDMTNKIYSDTLKVLNKVLEFSYKNIVFIGKSIGTIIIGRLRESLDDKYNMKSLYLTPIKPSKNYLNQFPGLAISGTMDKQFSEANKNEVVESEMMIVKANHALETRGTINTIKLHEEIIVKCESFLFD